MSGHSLSFEQEVHCIQLTVCHSFPQGINRIKKKEKSASTPCRF